MSAPLRHAWDVAAPCGWAQHAISLGIRPISNNGLIFFKRAMCQFGVRCVLSDSTHLRNSVCKYVREWGLVRQNTIKEGHKEHMHNLVLGQ